MRVLIPSDDRNFLPDLVLSYRRFGWDVVVGLQNLFSESDNYDLIHFQWPEELTNWKEPSAEQLEDIMDLLGRWSDKSMLIATTHNLYPHGDEKSELFTVMYSEFYSRMHLVSFFGDNVMKEFIKRYAVLSSVKKVITPLFYYTGMYQKSMSKESAMRYLGLEDNGKRVLSIGSIKNEKELLILRDVAERLWVADIQLTVIGSIYYQPGILRRLIRAARVRWWEQRSGLNMVTTYISDEDLVANICACDGLIVVRIDEISSGALSIGLTFNKPVIAPDYGHYIDAHRSECDKLYEVASARSIVENILELFKEKRVSNNVEKGNGLGSDSGWDGVLRPILENIGVIHLRANEK